MQKLLEIYTNSRLLLQQYGAFYSGIYLSFLLVVITWVLHGENDRSRSVKLFNYALLCFGAVFLLSVVGAFFPGNDYLHNVDLFMIIPVIILNILLCVYLGFQFKFRQRIIVLFFMIFIIAEASAPVTISFTDSFVIPSHGGKFSSDVIQICNVVGENTVVIPSSIENEYKEIYMLGTNIEIDTYDDGQSYISNANAADEVLDMGVKNDTQYVVVRVVNQLGETNIEEIESAASYAGYEIVEHIGSYEIAKKIEE